jgi:hypothetical protein
MSTLQDRFRSFERHRLTNPGEYYGSLEAAIFGDDAEQQAAFEHYRSRADAVLRPLNKAAPPPRFGESVIDYRRRCFDLYKGYGDTYKHVASSGLSREALNDAEPIALAEANKSLDASETPLEYVYRDDSDRKIRGWRGGPENWAWLPFTNGRRRGYIDSSLCTGANSAEAKAQRAEEASLLALGRAAKAAAQQSGASVELCCE